MNISKKFVKSMCFVVAILAVSLQNAVFSEEVNQVLERNGKSNLTVPWEEFKRLLKIDENDVVLPIETFQKLIAQTGAKITPLSFGGNVILKQEEFKSIINKMLAPNSTLSAPYEYIITKAVYQAAVQKENVSIRALFTVEVLKQGEYVKIPLVNSSFALEEFSVDNAPCLVITENGYHCLATNKSGKHTISANFAVKTPMGKGSHEFNMPILNTPITLLTLTVPLTDIDVTIPQAQKLIKTKRENYTVITCAILPTDNITISWTKELPVSERIASKLYAQVDHLVSIEDDVLKIVTDVQCNVLHSEIDSLRIVIPQGVNVLNVTGDQIGEWRETEYKGERLLIVPLAIPRKGNFNLQIVFEKPISEKETVDTFEGIKVLDCVRQNGYIGIELKTSAEVSIPAVVNLEKLAVEKLPPSVYERSNKPLMFGFKYLKNPYNIEIEIKKHEKIAVPVAVIDSANMVSFIVADGKIVHRLIYAMRNNGKQFLEIKLPIDSTVWGVFVNNEPVESSLGREGKLLVPLMRSKTVGNDLSSFDVEVVYLEKTDKMKFASGQEVKLPSCDLMSSQLIWSLYLPNNYRYLYFDSTLQKEALASGVNILAASGRVLDQDAAKKVCCLNSSSQTGGIAQKQCYERNMKSRFDGYEYDDEKEAIQIRAETYSAKRLEDISNSAEAGYAGSIQTGVLPIHIKIPVKGQVFRFAKSIVDPKDPLVVKFYYADNVIPKSVKTIIALIMLIVIWRFRSWIKNVFTRLVIKKST